MSSREIEEGQDLLIKTIVLLLVAVTLMIAFLVSVALYATSINPAVVESVDFKSPKTVVESLGELAGIVFGVFLVIEFASVCCSNVGKYISLR